jgi:hypothetical protein
MEDLTLSSEGGNLKKWVYFAPILPKAVAHSPNFQYKINQSVGGSIKINK